MSAINVIVQRDAVHILSDAVAYEADGTIQGFGPKVTVMPHLSCAFAFRGPLSVRPILGELLGHAATSYDELKAGIVPLLQEAARAYAPLFETCSAGPDFEVVVGGWSSSGPDAYIVASHATYGSPWTIIALPGLCITPVNDVIHERMIAALPPGCTHDDVEPEKHGLTILQIQRSYLIENGGMIDGKFCAIGGFAQLTSIGADSVTSRIIRRWSDKVGEPLAA